MAEITIEELTQIADDFLRANYGMALEIPIVRNNRLSRAIGRYLSEFEGTPLRIEIAGYLLKYGARETITDTLKHECVHYALHGRGEPYSDGHPHFEGELRRLGVSATGTCIIGPYVMYTCARCGKESKARGRRLLKDYSQRMTRCCGAAIRITGERIYDGSEAVT